MPVASDTILDWIHEDGYSLSETGWIQLTGRQACAETASLQPLLRDVFIIPGWTVRFGRESNSGVPAMLFNGYAIRNFRFTKQTP